MLKIALGTIAMGVLLVGPAASAADDTMGTTQAYERHEEGGYLRREAVSIKPELGVVAYTDAFGQDTSRGAAGLAVDANVVRWFTPDPTNIYAGPSSGVIYSHLGSPTSNFIGTNSSVSGQSDASLLIIPVNAKVGYTFGDAFRLAVHGGGNLIYRSSAGAVALGATTASSWDMFPNAGGDVEIGLTPNTALTLRPDVTFATERNLFSGMLALGFTLG